MSFFLGESTDEYARSLLKLEGRREGKKEREGGKEKERKQRKRSTCINIIEKLICEIHCSSIPTEAILAIMAFDPKLILLGYDLLLGLNAIRQLDGMVMSDTGEVRFPQHISLTNLTFTPNMMRPRMYGPHLGNGLATSHLYL